MLFIAGIKLFIDTALALYFSRSPDLTAGGKTNFDATTREGARGSHA